MTDAIVDAGPLIHLAELDALAVLNDFALLYITNAVWDEVAKHQPKALSSAMLHLEHTAAPAPSAELRTLAQGLVLDRGEIESLALMESHPLALFLTDDAAARLAAEQRGYRVHGTLGLLVRSVRKNLISKQNALQLIRSIPQRSTLHIRQNLLDEVIQLLEHEWN